MMTGWPSPVGARRQSIMHRRVYSIAARNGSSPNRESGGAPKGVVFILFIEQLRRVTGYMIHRLATRENLPMDDSLVGCRPTNV